MLVAMFLPIHRIKTHIYQ